jgi:hypothetical protein
MTNEMKNQKALYQLYAAQTGKTEYVPKPEAEPQQLQAWFAPRGNVGME